jgi:hypothetical protein
MSSTFFALIASSQLRADSARLVTLQRLQSKKSPGCVWRHRKNASSLAKTSSRPALAYYLLLSPTIVWVNKPLPRTRRVGNLPRAERFGQCSHGSKQSDLLRDGAAQNANHILCFFHPICETDH